MTNNVSTTSGARTTNWNPAPHTSRPSGSGVQWGANFQMGGNSLQSLIALLQSLLAQLLANRPNGGTNPNPPVKPNPPVNPNTTPTPVKNQAPNAVNDAATTANNTAVTLNVLGNDSDPDGDALTISSFDTASANGGTVTKDASGKLVYTPKTGFSGTDTFKYTVSDGKGGFSTATATVTVDAPKNNAPKANADTTTTNYGAATTINVLGNDTDADGDALTISAFDPTSANGGTVTRTADGKLTYTPKAGFSGTDTFSYTVSDGKGGTSTTTVTVTVGAKPNTPPVAANDSTNTAYGTAASLNVLGNDTDADGDALTITSFDTASANGGTVTKDASGNLVYTPKAGFSGTDTFKYTISDGKGGSSTATATVTVAGPVKPNDSPWNPNGWIK
ncbi:MAG: Ig-like domain-containing protein [Thiofilum sp.]|uniref:Ig-like domain-containing protein n=1 Tax=Thiofilum sp. TaxID=2212733 RepID=UPI0025DE1120|nr:Ig-like domain-containing protein [Thiofilum sp.]MBK8452870.1 tandem-95 repeat protein [Thiofilum sp.]